MICIRVSSKFLEHSDGEVVLAPVAALSWITQRQIVHCWAAAGIILATWIFYIMIQCRICTCTLGMTSQAPRSRRYSQGWFVSHQMARMKSRCNRMSIGQADSPRRKSTSKMIFIIGTHNMKQGFTLVELLVAIAIFSILVAIGVGGFVHALHTQREVAA